MKRIPVYVWLGVVPLFWGMNFHLARYCVQHLPPGIVGSVRFIIASLLLIPMFLIWERPTWGSLWRHMPAMAAVGVLGVFGYNYLFFKAMQTTSPTNASLLLALNPLVTLLLSMVWLKTKVRPLQWLGVMLGMGGVLLIISKGNPRALADLQVNTGDLLLLLVALSFAFANVVVRRYLHDAASLAVSAVSTVVGTLLLLIVTVSEHDPVASLTVTPYPVWLALVAMTMGGSVLGYIVWNYSVAKVGPDKAALFTNLAPLYTALISVSMGQAVEQLQLLGGAFIISGIVLATVKTPTKGPQSATAAI
ncbi:drug/metabolite transporter (DMT)-like permease [Pontibacter ummariensis]|uniref:Permease of the drug/metabolite transporter (DMT) superfamily n=1 Tax=Pontibacter ummariensis TaxID=1610492 RepID=A0A239LKM1_9BACT|nr:DMT family transporter [Pontibacter ummariensis]PRY03139.1 drug/metabolite transporter (DMT)-like permease [Pontibacter ummariensis]SNT30442.1 Permease of the drug/metabolite transporter (DMT) superfamily [Pontibacter ummariensis]